MKTLAAASLFLAGLVVLAGALIAGVKGAAIAIGVVTFLVPVLIDLGLVVVAPLESSLAASRPAQSTDCSGVAPIVVAITGSYGKTSTKGYLAYLLQDRFRVVASPQSFNNQAGLARTVNEHLVVGTEVLVAEMGTYGPGEIARMCSWLSPSVAIITAIGPVHLERFRSLDRTLEAKSGDRRDSHVGRLEHRRRAARCAICATRSDKTSHSVLRNPARCFGCRARVRCWCRDRR